MYRGLLNKDGDVCPVMRMNRIFVESAKIPKGMGKKEKRTENRLTSMPSSGFLVPLDKHGHDDMDIVIRPYRANDAGTGWVGCLQGHPWFTKRA